MFFGNQSINTTIKRRQDPQQIFHRIQNNTNCTTISRLFSQNTEHESEREKRERERGIYVDATDTYLPTYVPQIPTYLPTYLYAGDSTNFIFIFGGQFCDVAKSGDHP
jgi:hypothetical protein